MFCWDVVLKISVATVFTRCMKSFSLLDFAEVSVVLCITSSPIAQKIKLDKTIVIGSLRITLLLNSIQECQAKYVEKPMNLTLVKN